MKIYLSALFLSFFTIGCATSPDKIGASYVSPIRYSDYSCEQLGLEMENIHRRTSNLYRQLKNESTADSWQMAGGFLIWPLFFLLEGGDGPAAAEYAQLKGEFDALQKVVVQKSCGLDMVSPEETIKQELAKSQAEAESESDSE